MYQKLLEFYLSAYKLLSKERTKLVLAVIVDTGTLPDIVKDFLKQAEHLRRIVEKATFDVVQDIKAMLYDDKSLSSSFFVGDAKIVGASLLIRHSFPVAGP